MINRDVVTMVIKAKIFLYLALGCSLIGLIFPTHISQAIGFDIGDMIHWVYGFYILIPRNPIGNPRFYLSLDVQGLILLTSAILLIIIIFVQLRKVNRGKQYDKNLIYIYAIVQIIAYSFHSFTEFIVVPLSSWAFLLGAIFAIIGNRELKIAYIDNNNVNARRERILGIVLVALASSALIYTNVMFLIFGLPYGLNLFSFLFAFTIIPGLILQLIILFYGIFSIRRAKLQSNLE
ncbi:MAG: hypothetical protein EAX91_16735 [Candidatus Lokiarchaeota archaeon]|nr:hypothetical protein [Candidatus Lokiarchaeota archaeon]